MDRLTTNSAADYNPTQDPKACRIEGEGDTTLLGRHRHKLSGQLNY